MTPGIKSKKVPDLRDPVLRGVWRRFGLRPPPVSSPGLNSSCSTTSNASNDMFNARRGWEEEAEDPAQNLTAIEAPSLKISGSECNGIVLNSDSLEKTCIKLDILDAQISADSSSAQDQSAAANTNPLSIFNPIFLPIDKSYEAKYLMNKYRLGKKRGKTPQEQTYLFLEHPSGWFGFLYHMSV